MVIIFVILLYFYIRYTFDSKKLDSEGLFLGFSHAESARGTSEEAEGGETGGSQVGRWK